MTAEAQRPSPNRPNRLLVGCGVFLVGGICILFLMVQNYLRSLFITIGPDEVGVVISPYEPAGYAEEALTPGNHFMRPGERVEIYKVVRETYSTLSDSDCCSDESGAVIVHAKDDILLTVDYQVIFAIGPLQVLRLHREWQHRYTNGFVAPKSRQVVEEFTGAFASTEIALATRGEIEQAIQTALEFTFSEEGLTLIDFKVVDVRLLD